MIITWNMQSFLFEGASPTEQRLPFSKIPSGGSMKKTNTLPIACVPKPCFFLHTLSGVYFFNVSLWIKSYSVPLNSINDCIHKNQPLYFTQIY